MDCQDWTPVILKPKTGVITRSSTAATAASSEARRIAKIENAEAPKGPKTLSHEGRQLLIQSRLLLKKKQTELDQMCAFPPHTIQQLETGKRAPTGSELQKLNRVLKTGLTLTH
jgi:Helix-turn-helix